MSGAYGVGAANVSGPTIGLYLTYFESFNMLVQNPALECD